MQPISTNNDQLAASMYTGHRHTKPNMASSLSNWLVRVQPQLWPCAIVLIACWFYLSDLGYSSLSHAEAWRANWFHHGDLNQARRFPPLQFGLLWVLQHGVSRSEFVLRLPSALAGVASVALLFVWVKRSFGIMPGLLSAAALASHAALVAQARVLKVFSLEVLAIVVLFTLGCAAYQKRSVRAMAFFVVASVLAIGFSFTAAMVIAAWMPILAWRFLRRSRGETKLTREFLTCTALLMVVGLAWRIQRAADVRQLLLPDDRKGLANILCRVRPRRLAWQECLRVCTISFQRLTYLVAAKLDCWNPYLGGGSQRLDFHS